MDYLVEYISLIKSFILERKYWMYLMQTSVLLKKIVSEKSQHERKIMCIWNMTHRTNNEMSHTDILM